MDERKRGKDPNIGLTVRVDGVYYNEWDEQNIRWLAD